MTFQPNDAVLVSFGSEWRHGIVVGIHHNRIEVVVGGRIIHIHQSVYRRDVRRGKIQ